MCVKRTRMQWNSKVDDRPNINSPRIRFSQIFSKSYLKGAYRILDTGCGIGSYTYLLDKCCTVGIDIDLNALKTAKKYCTNSEFILASVLHLPFKDETFDVVLMWEVIEYIEKETERSAIQEIHRALSPRARLLLSAPNYHFIYNVMDPDHFFLRRQRHFVLEKLVGLISETGFSINQKTIRGGWKTIVAMNIFYLHKYFLHNKGGKIQTFLDKKSEEELNSNMKGITNIFIAAQKITN
jgi:2-polyprenyl-3-methyl-5-hydroxy-6-metoxy-1,4-benzoquinol methylase